MMISYVMVIVYTLAYDDFICHKVKHLFKNQKIHFITKWSTDMLYDRVTVHSIQISPYMCL